MFTFTSSNAQNFLRVYLNFAYNPCTSFNVTIYDIIYMNKFFDNVKLHLYL